MASGEVEPAKEMEKDASGGASSMLEESLFSMTGRGASTLGFSDYEWEGKCIYMYVVYTFLNNVLQHSNLKPLNTSLAYETISFFLFNSEHSNAILLTAIETTEALLEKGLQGFSGIEKPSVISKASGRLPFGPQVLRKCEALQAQFAF